MRKGRKIKSKKAAVANVKKLFSMTPEADSITIYEAFTAWGRRNLENDVANKAWLSNMLFHLKYHNLVTPIYSFSSGPRKLDKLQLTLEGKRELGRVEDDQVDNDKGSHVEGVRNDDNSPSIDQALEIVKEWKKRNPEYEVTFDIKWKGVLEQER